MGVGDYLYLLVIAFTAILSPQFFSVLSLSLSTVFQVTRAYVVYLHCQIALCSGIEESCQLLAKLQLVYHVWLFSPCYSWWFIYAGLEEGKMIMTLVFLMIWCVSVVSRHYNLSFVTDLSRCSHILKICFLIFCSVILIGL